MKTDYIEMVKHRRPDIDAIYENPRDGADLLVIADDLELLANAVEQKMRAECPWWKRLFR